MPASLIRIAAAIAVFMALTGQGPAPEAPPETPAAAPALSQPAAGDLEQQGTRALDAADLGAWLDGVIPANLAQGDIAGATVSVVKDGKLLLARGYGFADVEKRTPVVAERTLFRTGSISKLFTWTAVMQLVEDGRLDLDRDVNAYLDFKIPPRAGGPVTLRNLMTHTGGFQEWMKNPLLTDPKGMVPLTEAVRGIVPARIFPAGEIPAYSNYGATLAGYIVQRVSGVPFVEYLEKRIFTPLGMQDTSFRQPLPARLQHDMATGYMRASGDEVPFEFSPDSPAGGQSATATDMARFMLAHLNGGALPGGGRILRPETTRLMHSVANRPAPGVDAMALGFYEENRNGYRVIAHGGDMIAFHSDLHLIQSENVGIFVSFNSVGKDGAAYKLRTLLYEGFMDRYFPRRVPLRPGNVDADMARRHAETIAGNYRSSRRAGDSLFTFLYMLGQKHVRGAKDGTVVFDWLTGLNDVPMHFREVSPWLWRDVAGQTQVAVKRRPDGGIAYLAADGSAPIAVLQPVPPGLDASWIVPALVVAAAVLLLSLFAWPGGWALRRYAGRSRPELSGPAAQNLWSRRAAAAVCLVFLALVALFLIIASGESSWLLTDDADWFVRTIQVLGLLSVLAAALAVIAAVRDWIAGDRSIPRRTAATVVALACAMVAYVAVAFHFLHFSLNY